MTYYSYTALTSFGIYSTEYSSASLAVRADPNVGHNSAKSLMLRYLFIGCLPKPSSKLIGQCILYIWILLFVQARDILVVINITCY